MYAQESSEGSTGCGYGIHVGRHCHAFLSKRSLYAFAEGFGAFVADQLTWLPQNPCCDTFPACFQLQVDRYIYRSSMCLTPNQILPTPPCDPMTRIPSQPHTPNLSSHHHHQPVHTIIVFLPSTHLANLRTEFMKRQLRVQQHEHDAPALGGLSNIVFNHTQVMQKST